MPSSARQIPNGKAVNDCVNFDHHSSPDLRAFALDSELSAVGEDQVREGHIGSRLATAGRCYKVR